MYVISLSKRAAARLKVTLVNLTDEIYSDVPRSTAILQKENTAIGYVFMHTSMHICIGHILTGKSHLVRLISINRFSMFMFLLYFTNLRIKFWSLVKN